MPHPETSRATELDDPLLDASGGTDGVLAAPDTVPSELAPLVPLPREERARAAGEARRLAAAARLAERQRHDRRLAAVRAWRRQK